jgi:hypothetical protein
VLDLLYCYESGTETSIAAKRLTVCIKDLYAYIYNKTVIVLSLTCIMIFIVL